VQRDDGFTLIGLMVVIAVINIGLAVALTSWIHVDKRAKEAELIWRGEQYARALQCHRAQTGGLPEKLDELLDSDCIRSLYPDPMVRSGEWRVIRESELNEEWGGGAPGGAPGPAARELEGPPIGGAAAGGGSGSPGEAVAPSLALGLALGRQGNTPGGAQGDSLTQAYVRLRNLSGRLQQNGRSGTGNGIAGVVSTSTAAGLRAYDGEATYDMWRFVVR
jgi:type II secretory pathway pseudopilin PulG